MKVLVVVDMQIKFVESCGASAIISRVIDKIHKRKAEGYEIILTYDKYGDKIIKDIADICQGCKVYKKQSYGCKELILDLAERKPECVELVGVCTDICVITNALAVMTFLPSTKITVDNKCCASTSRGHGAAIAVMKACNITVI